MNPMIVGRLRSFLTHPPRFLARHPADSCQQRHSIRIHCRRRLKPCPPSHLFHLVVFRPRAPRQLLRYVRHLDKSRFPHQTLQHGARVRDETEPRGVLLDKLTVNLDWAVWRERAVITVAEYVMLHQLDISAGCEVVIEAVDIGAPVTDGEREVAGVDKVKVVLFKRSLKNMVSRKREREWN
jgi:hypothetical protein